MSLTLWKSFYARKNKIDLDGNIENLDICRITEIKIYRITEKSIKNISRVDDWKYLDQKYFLFFFFSFRKIYYN
jgi:hypothetical protein